MGKDALRKLTADIFGNTAFLHLLSQRNFATERARIKEYEEQMRYYSSVETLTSGDEGYNLTDVVNFYTGVQKYKAFVEMKKVIGRL